MQVNLKIHSSGWRTLATMPGTTWYMSVGFNMYELSSCACTTQHTCIGQVPGRQMPNACPAHMHWSNARTVDALQLCTMQAHNSLGSNQQ